MERVTRHLLRCCRPLDGSPHSATHTRVVGVAMHPWKKKKENKRFPITELRCKCGSSLHARITTTVTRSDCYDTPHAASRKRQLSHGDLSQVFLYPVYRALCTPYRCAWSSGPGSRDAVQGKKLGRAVVAQGPARFPTELHSHCRSTQRGSLGRSRRRKLTTRGNLTPREEEGGSPAVATRATAMV